MEHIATVLARCAALLTELRVETIVCEALPDDFRDTQPVVREAGVDAEAGDA